MPSVFGCISSGSRYGNVPNEFVHRAGPPFLDNHYRGYQLHVPNIKHKQHLCMCNFKLEYNVVVTIIVSTHRRILGMAPVVCVLVKICVSSISFYKLDTDKLTTPFESAHQFTLVCTVSDSKTVPGCHYNLCSNHSFVLTD